MPCCGEPVNETAAIFDSARFNGLLDSEGKAMEWIVLGFLVIHLLLFFGVFAGLFYEHFVRGRRNKSDSHHSRYPTHSTR